MYSNFKRVRMIWHLIQHIVRYIQMNVVPTIDIRVQLWKVMATKITVLLIHIFMKIM